MSLVQRKEKWEEDYKKSPEEISCFESGFYRHIKGLNDSILDDGCGTLRGALELGIQGRYLVGLDFSKEALKIAKENRDKKGKKQQVDLVCAAAEHLPFKNESFDTVLCIETLKYAESTYRKVLDEAKRVSRGKLVLTFDHRNEWYNISRLYGTKFTIKDNALIFNDIEAATLAFDEKPMKKFLKDIGLKVSKLAVNETDRSKDALVKKLVGPLPSIKVKSSIYVECEKKTS